ncbi:hypothetical protein VST63_20650 [Mycolicibacterium sp. 050232]|uniref:hypothetical protein n=1 Tax=Mycolicibacterium sp. 050232 TaxID=3113982 RepID=UPI002E2CE71B|nr:hypothetical protein [Mycolicibacterium sp. 050232]MED5814777.1 hypothetical protein [Mycolicibacterium sp. 050232]
MTAWLRRNRWGLLALPLATVAAISANAQRLHDYWWDQDLRRAAATGSAGQWVSWTDSFSDAMGPGTRTLQVKVTDAGPTDVVQSRRGPKAVSLPSDLTGWGVTLDFKAAGDQVLSGCRLALLDTEGNRYLYQMTIGDASQELSPCLPPDHPGPSASITAGEPRSVLPGEERPPQWTTRPVMLVPRDATITQVLLWWEDPDYLAVQLD